MDSKNQNKIYDAAIIGAGPAGMTAAIYLTRSGLSTVMFDSLAPGGQLADTAMIYNYPGFPKGVSGFELAEAMREQAEVFGVETVLEEVVSVDAKSEPKSITTSLNNYEAQTLIIASGARPKKLGIPLEEEMTGRGVSYCAMCDGDFFRGKTVMVTGGGNTAAGNVLHLARICKKVYLVHRRDTLRASTSYLQHINSCDNVEFLWNSVPRAILEDEGKLAGVTIEHVATGEREDISCDGLFVAVGTEPNTEFLGGTVALDEQGYIISDENGVTSAPGVFAAGDVRAKSTRQVVTAVGDGANTAEAAANYLVS